MCKRGHEISSAGTCTKSECDFRNTKSTWCHEEGIQRHATRAMRIIQHSYLGRDALRALDADDEQELRLGLDVVVARLLGLHHTHARTYARCRLPSMRPSLSRAALCGQASRIRPPASARRWSRRATTTRCTSTATWCAPQADVGPARHDGQPRANAAQHGVAMLLPAALRVRVSSCRAPGQRYVRGGAGGAAGSAAFCTLPARGTCRQCALRAAAGKHKQTAVRLSVAVWPVGIPR